MNNFDKVEAIRDLWHCHNKQDLAKMVVELQGNIQEMVAKTAANKLDGYRELSERACRAEEARDALAAHVEVGKALVRDLLIDDITDDATRLTEWCALDSPATSLAKRDLVKQAEILHQAQQTATEQELSPGLAINVMLEELRQQSNELEINQ